MDPKGYIAAEVEDGFDNLIFGEERLRLLVWDFGGLGGGGGGGGKAAMLAS